MRHSVTSASLLASWAFVSQVSAQESTTAQFNVCLANCDAPVSSCFLIGPDASCSCRPEDTSPDAQMAACLKNCTSILEVDHTDFFDSSCNEIFEATSADGDDEEEEDEEEDEEEEEPSSTSDESPPSETEESDTEESPDAALARGASVVLAGAGLFAAFIL